MYRRTLTSRNQSNQYDKKIGDFALVKMHVAVCNNLTRIPHINTQEDILCGFTELVL